MSASIVLIDDHKIVREVLRLLLHNLSFRIVGEAETLASGLQAVWEKSPDLVIIDVRLPDGNGLMAAALIRRRSSAVKLVVLSGFASCELIREAMQVGVHGFVTKQESADELVEAVRRVLSGKHHVSPGAKAILDASARL